MSIPNEAPPRISTLRIEHASQRLGLGTAQPRLSWQIESVQPGWRQAAYALRVNNADGTRYDETGQIHSDQSILVAWPFAPLRSRQQISIQVKVWDTTGQESAWSTPLTIEMGLLEAADWEAQFISPGWDEDTSIDQPCPMLRREFLLRPGLVHARLYTTALGVYEAEINGLRVGESILEPGWTSYHHRLCYQTYDVTALLEVGANAIGVWLGDGWYRGRLGWKDQRNVYGERLAALAQLELRYADGSIERIVTDEAWRATTGPLRASSLYDGEDYDARQELQGWSSPGYDDGAWAGVQVLPHERSALVAPLGPPVCCTETVAPVAITTSPSGRTIVDFGQNLVGRVRFTAQGAAGQTITLRHAEVLEDGELATRPLRTARATNRYTLRGGAPETWEPRFTFQGFRYLEVDGWPGQLQLSDLVARVYHSDMERTGWFACSEPLLNRFHENVVWSMRGNFLSIPTDCPQRDERLGWTGDIQVFAPTATFLYACAGFLDSWLHDLALEQQQHGGIVPIVIPNVLGEPFAATAWGDAAAIVPWVLYQRYGDRDLLARQYPSMAAWVDTVARLAGPGRLWDTGFQFGDWLDPSAPPEHAAQARTSPAIVATAYFAHSARLTSEAAALLGDETAAEQYGALAAEVRAAFCNAYVAPDGLMRSDAETAYALALAFELLPDAAARQRAAERLGQLVVASGFQIATGFVGTPLICDVLTNIGRLDLAYQLLMQRHCPSWLYPVIMGATTIWERWDSLRPDGTINPGGMTSFNHYALGAVADWVQRTVAGLAPATAGYRTLRIQPRPGGGLTWAQARHRTPYGMAEVDWALEGGTLTVRAVVPPNSTAIVVLPGAEQKPFEVGAGRYTWVCPWP
jgi:alpha-L-rhamnosidase